MLKNTDDIILRFFRDDIGGILITDEAGAAVYEDERSAMILRERTNWAAACPPPREGQRREIWDLVRSESGKTCMVLTSTILQDGGMLQIHQLVDTTPYMEINRDMGQYSKELQREKDHDGLTGLYNKGRFLTLKRTLFRNQPGIAVFNMDVNNLKQINDTKGHEAGDQLIRKAAESLLALETRSVLPFRVGGDEFVLVALHMTREEAEALHRRWEETLAELNSRDNGINCVIACGFAYGEEGYDLEEVLARADALMYEDKRKKKQLRG